MMKKMITVPCDVGMEMFRTCIKGFHRTVRLVALGDLPDNVKSLQEDDNYERYA